MLLTHLHRFYTPISVSIPIYSSSFYAHLFHLPKTRLPITSALCCTAFSTLSSVGPVLIHDSSSSISAALEDTRIETPHHLLIPEEAQIKISLEKLFIPLDTDISSRSAPLRTRVLKGSNIVLRKYARDAQITQADFVKSNTRTKDCPSEGLPKFALVGLSNVGKSSLFNSLV